MTLDVPLKRFIRDWHSSTQYSTDENVLMTNGRELKCYVEIMEDDQIQIGIVTLILVSHPT